MNSRRHTYTQGWTLSETLIVMIVAGVVFLTMMDGLVLFNRYVGRKTQEITGNLRLGEGADMLRHLAAVSDSIAEGIPATGMGMGMGMGMDAGAGADFGASTTTTNADFGAGTVSRISLFREETPVADLTATADSLLIAHRASRTDTLMSPVSALRLAETSERGDADSILVTIRTPEGSPLTLSFPVHHAAGRLAVRKLHEKEQQYTYE
jgi:hypothetical protein